MELTQEKVDSITPEDVRAWYCEQPASRPLFDAVTSARGCVLSKFFSDMTGELQICGCFSVSTAEAWETTAECNLPAWMQNFIRDKSAIKGTFGSHYEETMRLLNTASAPGDGGFWSNFDVVPCSDGTARRVEPGSFPLAYGVSGRVAVRLPEGSAEEVHWYNRTGALRGFGNAINPQLFAVFIEEARQAILEQMP